jgi:hypothetical protein
MNNDHTLPLLQITLRTLEVWQGLLSHCTTKPLINLIKKDRIYVGTTMGGELVLKTDLSKEQVMFLSESIRHSFQMDELKKGFDLFKNGNVFNVHVNDSHVQGTVLDSIDQRVEIDLDFFQVSTCSCKSKIECKHKAALFFYVYSAYNNAELLLTKWQLEHATAVNQGKSRPMISLIPTPPKKSVSIAPPNPDSVEDWHRFFEETYQQLINQTSSYQDIYNQYYISATHIALKSNSDATLKVLYEIHALIDTMYRIFHYAQQPTTPDYSHFYLGHIIEELLEDLLSALEDYRNSPNHKIYEEHLEKSIPIFNRLLLQPRLQPEYRLLVYRMVWEKLFYHPKWILENKEWLMKQMNHSIDTMNRELFLLECSIVHMDFLLGQDREAFERLQSFSAYWQDEPFVWLHLLKEKQQWSRLQKWLAFLTPHIDQEDKELIGFLIHDWAVYMDQTGEKAGFEHALQRLLPTSCPYYGQYLLEEKRYKEYVELQLHIQVHPTEWNQMELKVIEKDDINHLLPLYHQSIDRLIVERNRPAYKFAVRLLQKLRLYYKRLKLQERWEDYVNALVAQNSRLSALKEEMRKGKLIR